MATKLTKPVVREVQVRAEDPATDEVKEGPVVVTMSANGLELRKKGAGRKVFLSWERIGKAIWLPEDAPEAPAKYINNHLGWLLE